MTILEFFRIISVVGLISIALVVACNKIVNVIHIWGGSAPYIEKRKSLMRARDALYDLQNDLFRHCIQRRCTECPFHNHVLNDEELESYKKKAFYLSYGIESTCIIRKTRNLIDNEINANKPF